MMRITMMTMTTMMITTTTMMIMTTKMMIMIVEVVAAAPEAEISRETVKADLHQKKEVVRDLAEDHHLVTEALVDLLQGERPDKVHLDPVEEDLHQIQVDQMLIAQEDPAARTQDQDVVPAQTQIQGLVLPEEVSRP
jgi:hypothetical protein